MPDTTKSKLVLLWWRESTVVHHLENYLLSVHLIHASTIIIWWGLQVFFFLSICHWTVATSNRRILLETRHYGASRDWLLTSRCLVSFCLVNIRRRVSRATSARVPVVYVVLCSCRRTQRGRPPTVITGRPVRRCATPRRCPSPSSTTIFLISMSMGEHKNRRTLKKWNWGYMIFKIFML